MHRPFEERQLIAPGARYITSAPLLRQSAVSVVEYDVKEARGIFCPFFLLFFSYFCFFLVMRKGRLGEALTSTPFSFLFVCFVLLCFLRRRGDLTTAPRYFLGGFERPTGSATAGVARACKHETATLKCPLPFSASVTKCDNASNSFFDIFKFIN